MRGSGLGPFGCSSTLAVRSFYHDSCDNRAMPWKQIEQTFYDSSREPILFHTSSCEEPVSPATSTVGATVSLYDTPASVTETYRAVRCAGPAAARIDISLDGGAFAPGASGIAVGGTPGVERALEFRVVSLPYAGSGLNPNVGFAVVVTDSGEASWMG